MAAVVNVYITVKDKVLQNRLLHKLSLRTGENS